MKADVGGGRGPNEAAEPARMRTDASRRTFGAEGLVVSTEAVYTVMLTSESETHSVAAVVLMTNTPLSTYDVVSRITTAGM
jgi:hypothetical protein